MNWTLDQVSAAACEALRRGSLAFSPGPYRPSLEGATLTVGDACGECQVAAPGTVCTNCHGLRCELYVLLAGYHGRVRLHQRTLDDEVLGLLVVAEEILACRIPGVDPMVVVEYCEDWRDEQHLRELVRYWSSRTAVESGDPLDEHVLNAAAWYPRFGTEKAPETLLPQHRRAHLLAAAALLLAQDPSLEHWSRLLHMACHKELEDGR